MTEEKENIQEAEQLFTFTKEELTIIQTALVHGLDAVTTRVFPQVFSYVSTKTGEKLKDATHEQIQSGEVVIQTELQETFSKPTIHFTEKWSPYMIDATILVNQKMGV